MNNKRQIDLPEKDTPYIILVGQKDHEIVDLPAYGNCTIITNNGKMDVEKTTKTRKINIV